MRFSSSSPRSVLSCACTSIIIAIAGLLQQSVHVGRREWFHVRLVMVPVDAVWTGLDQSIRELFAIASDQLDHPLAVLRPLLRQRELADPGELRHLQRNRLT